MAKNRVASLRIKAQSGLAPMRVANVRSACSGSFRQYDDRAEIARGDNGNAPDMIGTSRVHLCPSGRFIRKCSFLYHCGGVVRDMIEMAIIVCWTDTCWKTSC